MLAGLDPLALILTMAQSSSGDDVHDTDVWKKTCLQVFAEDRAAEGSTQSCMYLKQPALFANGNTHIAIRPLLPLNVRHKQLIHVLARLVEPSLLSDTCFKLGHLMFCRRSWHFSVALLLAFRRRLFSCLPTAVGKMHALCCIQCMEFAVGSFTLCWNDPM